jgi:site-specific recombinase XerD
LISEYLAERKRGGLSASSIKLIVVALKIFFRFAVAQGFVPRDPTDSLSLPRIDRYLPETLNELQVEQLLESVDCKAHSACGIAPCWNCFMPVDCAFPNWPAQSWKILISRKVSCA